VTNTKERESRKISKKKTKKKVAWSDDLVYLDSKTFLSGRGLNAGTQKWGPNPWGDSPK